MKVVDDNFKYQRKVVDYESKISILELQIN
jgi:hypothetical protein